jgi:hypothetical protein
MTTATDSTDTMTVTIPKALAWRLKSACNDSSNVWHQHWRDALAGKRDDLDASACRSISDAAWTLWEILDAQGI